MDTEESFAVDELNSIGEVLSDSECEPLLPEIIWSALNFMKQVPNATISEAMNFGVGEWIK
jgi:hypothetical protein